MKWLALFVVACSAPAPHPAVTKPPAPPTPVVHDTGPIPTVHKPRPVIEAPHAGAIVELALSPDGTAVLSADELGGIRLWPTLDGTQEPRIVSLPAAKQLALSHDTSGYTAVVLDEVGGLYLGSLDATGRIVAHVTLPPDPPFAGMVMTELGLVAWRTDQTITLLDAKGVVRSQVATEPRERIVSIAVAGKRAVALIEKDTTRIFRWLTLEPKLAWGDALKMEDSDRGDQIALSPHATRIATLHTDPKTKQVQVWILDTAKQQPITTAPIGGNVELGFIDDDRLAIGTQQGVLWLDANAGEKTNIAPAHNELFRRNIAFATGGGRAVNTTNGELQLVTPDKAEYLGYAVIAPRLVEPASGGELLVGTSVNFTRLDPSLHATGSPIVFPGNVTQFLSVGGESWLVESVDTTNKLRLDLITGSKTTKVRDLTESNVMMYEPSTQLVTLSFGAVAEVAQLDTKARTLETRGSIPKGSPYEQVLIAPLSPKLAGGLSLVQVTLRDKPTVKWLRALDKPASTLSIDGSYAAADAAGHVYLWRTGQGGKLELAVYADGKPIAQLPSDGPTSLWPDRLGKTVAVVGANTIALHEAADGKQLWAQEFGGIQEALWLDDGSLAITSGGGIARLDPATGETVAARCGWSFGLSSSPHPPGSRVESLCVQLDR